METAQPTEQQTIYQAPTPNIKKPFRLSLKLKILIGFLIIVFAIAFLGFIKTKYQDYRSGLVDFNKNDEVPSPTMTEPDFTKKKEYKDELRKFSVQYPEIAQLNNEKALNIWFTGSRQGPNFNVDNDLRDGFIFRVSVTQNVINEDIKIAAEQKLQHYRQDCGEFYSSSSLFPVELDTVPGYGFSITNCPVDVEEMFVLYNNSIYEISLIYKGDIGYKERYKQMAKEILSSYTFLDKPETPEAPKLITYTNEKYQLSFVHPRFDYDCCTISGPVFGKPELVVTIADGNKYQQNSGRSFDGMAVYIDPNTENASFESYLDIQKKSLIENYKIVRGDEPKTSEKTIKVGGVDAVLLKGYAWWGDLVYLPKPGSNQFLIIAKVESEDGSFEKTFNEILNTFQF
jgi:hypothetical protein